MSESSTTEPTSAAPKQRQYLLYGGILTIACCISFVAGMWLQSSRDDNATTRTGMMGEFDSGDQVGPGMGAGRMRGGSFGTVTAISESSISIEDQRQGTVVTYAITSDTSITDSGTAAAISDITDGDTVMVVPDSDDSSTAAAINLGGPGGYRDEDPTTDTQLN